MDPNKSPVRFIFSHSALREGWDNPNVFQICTLKQSSSDVRNLFDKELVKIIQTDAMDRCGLKQLIFEPEILEQVEPDISLA